MGSSLISFLPQLLPDDSGKVLGKRLDLVLVLTLDHHADLGLGAGIPHEQAAYSILSPAFNRKQPDTEQLALQRGRKLLCQTID